MSHNNTDYEKVYAEFRYDAKHTFNFAVDVIDRWAEKKPEKPAIQWIDDNGLKKTRTFSDIRNHSLSIASALYKSGLRQNDIIMVMLGRDIEWWEILTASIRLGLVFIPISDKLTHKDLEYRLNSSEAACFVTNSENAGKFELIDHMCPYVRVRCLTDEKTEDWLSIGEMISDYPPEGAFPNGKPEESSIIYFTSGTGGLPKMASHSLPSYSLSHYVTGKYWLNLSENDTVWHIGDTGWAKSTWSAYFGPWHMGATVFVHNSSRFDPEKTLEILSEYPVTTLCTTPTAYRMMADVDLERYSFKGLKHLVAAGEPLNSEVAGCWLEKKGLVIHNGYGQTETSLLCGMFKGMESPKGSMGKPAPGVVLDIIDPSGNIMPVNEEGEIAVKIAPVKPPGIFNGYVNENGAYDIVYKKDYFLTGDRARKDENGFLWFIGRTDDVIVTSGYRISPFEVETALDSHNAVLESAVVACHDEIRGEIVKAFVVLSPGHSGTMDLEKELQDHVQKKVAAYKYPRKIEFIDSLPKSMSGKIKREVLRHMD